MTIRTILLPTAAGAFWDDFAWPSKAPADTLPYSVDAGPWLADAGLTLLSVDVTASAGLMVGAAVRTGPDNNLVTVKIGGGVPGTVAQVRLLLRLSNGDTLDVLVALKIRGDALGSLILPPAPSADAGIGRAQYLAGGAVSAYRVLMPGFLSYVIHADPTTGSYVFVGISTRAASAGGLVEVCEAGLLVEPTWSWTVGQPLYVGATGILTQTPPTVGVLQQVAVAISATSILVQPFPPITLN